MDGRAVFLEFARLFPQSSRTHPGNYRQGRSALSALLLGAYEDFPLSPSPSPCFPPSPSAFRRFATDHSRCDFAIDSTRTIDTALAPPPSRPLFQGSPSANALAARELLVTSATYRYARARTAHARRTHARGSGGRVTR